LFLVSFTRVVRTTRKAMRALRGHQLPVPAFLEVLTPADVSASLVLLEETASTAYCIGLLRPQVVVSSGLLTRLDEPGLRAVLAHESSHCRRRDPLRAALSRSLARGLFYVPMLRDLAEATLAENEISADAKAVRLAGRANLVRALLAMLRSPAPSGAANMASDGILQLRLNALESGGPPGLRLRRTRAVASLLLVAALLAAGAWLPRYPQSRIVKSQFHPVPTAHHNVPTGRA
jgi:Zn-dependent protease with chaperone function